MLQLITPIYFKLKVIVIFYNMVKEEYPMRKIRQDLLSKTIKNKREKKDLKNKIKIKNDTIYTITILCISSKIKRIFYSCI